MQEFEGRTAFITGGASGIGLAMARSFAAAGMRVAIADVEAPALAAAVASLRASNADVLGIELDVRDRLAMDAAARQVTDHFGAVHVLCNNAGVGAGGPLQDATHADWDWTLGVNLQGVINGLQSFLPGMIAHGEGGHVVNTASMAGLLGVGGMGIYNASKFAVVGLSESLIQDLVGTGVGVSVLCPGFVRTNIFDSTRNRPDELAGAPRTRSEEDEARVEEIIARAIEPQQVAEQVLEAVRTEQFWIFTHPEFADVVKAKMGMMAAAFGTGS
ncbi:MAG: SDR family NAD(P)-dependent oxidoreductase [Pseudomonadales bacterium]|jgi:NAD(P)-dependent dehydrogenase (short-subunit alcohol dehydrogenase family)|nr:SDR family NAD(P)-dependent oxidoreductase [Pseudomonadales bacterium]